MATLAECVTIKARQEFIASQVATNDAWATRALIAIYKMQTADEQSAQSTAERNNVGFTGLDAPFLSSLAESYLKYGRLTEKQLAHVKKKMPKYRRQLELIARK